MVTISAQNNKWWVFAAVVMAMSMIFTDQNIIPVTLPTIQREFNTSEIQMQWIVNSYYLTMAVLMLMGGKVSDIFGHRRVFCIGIIIFTSFALMCAISINIQWLIISRIFQGAGAALLLPTIFALIVESFPENQRGVAVGLNTSISSLFLATMPYVGGYFTQYFSWRLVFLVHLPIALAGLILALIVIPKSKKKEERFDFYGFSFFSLGFVSLTLAVMQAKNWGWGSFPIISLFLISFIFFILLFLSHKKVKEPFIDFSLFKKKFFLGGSIGIFFVQFVLMMTVYWPIYFQEILNFTPTKAVLVMMISFLPMLIMAPLGGKLLDKYGPKVPVFCGCLLIAFAYTWFSFFITKKDILWLLPSFLTVGWGVTFAMTATVTSSVSASNLGKRGIASGITGMMRTSGRSFGIAILGAIYINMKYTQLEKFLAREEAAVKLDPNVIESLLVKSQKAKELIQSLPSDTAQYVKEALYLTTKDSFITINVVAAILSLLILITYLWITKNKKSPV